MFEVINNKPFTVNSVSVKNIVASDEMKEEVLAKCAGLRVIPAAYSDYGGSLIDVALIRYAEENDYPLVKENSWWCGENAVVLLPARETDLAEGGEFYFLDDTILEIEREMLLDALNSLVEEYNLDEEESDFAENWLDYNCHFYPAGADFSDSDFEEALAEFKKQEVKA